MNILAKNNWIEANQRYLKATLDVVRAAMECHIVMMSGESAADPERKREAEEKGIAAQQALQEAVSAMPKPSTVEALCSAFGLSSFERDILLLCTGIEFDSTFTSLCAAAQGDATKTYPTFSLALAALPQPHWEALVPDAPLRYWRLIEVGTGSLLTLNSLRIDERILHYLIGMQHLDERLVGLVQPVRDTGDLVPSHVALAERVGYVWRQAASSAVLSIVQLCGDETASKLAIAAAACNASGLKLYRMAASALPTSPVELDAFQRLWERESVLSGCVLLIECDELDATDSAHGNAITQLLENMRSPLVISNRERWRTLRRPVISFDVCRPTLQEQRATWQQALGEAAGHLNGRLDGLVSQFSLSTSTILSTSIEVLGYVKSVEDAAAIDEMSSVLWDTCRLQARPQLEGLAQRIDPVATWEDLVLPDAQRSILREIAAHVRQRNKVYEAWGFARKSSRGLGISALFAGMSGTGKTLAAEVLAHELRLDLYHIDLSSIVSKYIGETEKNLRRVFDAAEEGGAILLFDEADALFGKRSEVKDSHDRYANIEVSYLLQRMEAYRGLAILTTNMKNALDAAFLRRIRFIVQFPFPDAVQRAEIWRRIFPPATPTERLDVGKLARLNVTGGNIRNIALSAAFLAANAGEPVRMKHLVQAARGEYAKLEKPLTESEIGGWI
ncbi:ATP-binding protein [Ktedonobacter racemifer]|uniref:AAA ATPase central domain protein n=1 Tax=Ktedonobacter racemifer DSM 44963 TaxID=485913 RepID=D6TXC2_KTERA|nr:ATP-binding protein [Ktedonobacter racemifer]EFH84855.1 AAA ATPase central domain protein [Ktedonobacter racemifer DSM 44963]